MNVYDFDETIYDGDSTVDFVKYSFIHRPKCLIALPKIAFTGLLFVLKIVDKMTFKKTLYSYFIYIKDMDNLKRDADIFVMNFKELIDML